MGMNERPQQHYLKLLVSGAAFVILCLGLILLLLPNPWAIAAGVALGAAGGAGTYGLMHGRELSVQRRATEVRSEQQDLQKQLQTLEQTIRGRSQQLPPSTQGQLRMMVVGLEEIVERWSSLDRVPEHQEGVRRTVEHHLPHTLEIFLQLPDAAKPEHAAEFKAQVSLLAEAVAKTRDRVVRQDLQALRANRWLLEESLDDADAKRFRDQGL